MDKIRSKIVKIIFKQNRIHLCNNQVSCKLTTVLPLFMLWRSLWACAQKSIQDVTPENGRPSWNPSLQSIALSSNATYKTNKSNYFMIRYDQILEIENLSCLGQQSLLENISTNQLIFTKSWYSVWTAAANTVDSFVFVCTNFQGLRKTCISMDI